MVTFRGRHGCDGKADLIDGFEVLLGGRVVGFIWPGGTLSKSYPEGGEVEHPDAILTKSEALDIWEKCAKVRKMPREYGWSVVWIGVGEPADSPEPKLVSEKGRVYEEIMPGVQLHRRDLEDSHDTEI